MFYRIIRYQFKWLCIFHFLQPKFFLFFMLFRSKIPTFLLHKMRELSGAHFVARTASGSVVASTLPEGTALPATLPTAALAEHLDSFASHTIVTLGETRYFAQQRRDEYQRILGGLLNGIRHDDVICS